MPDKPEVMPSEAEIMLIWNAVGLSGEAGEVLDEIKKVVFHRHSLDKQKLANELGDCMFYIAALCTKLELDIGAVMEENVAKLKARFPTGFNSNDSINR
jgi:NTP pyrophosphatase (non-canonical NTP hydrolase)